MWRFGGLGGVMDGVGLVGDGLRLVLRVWGGVRAVFCVGVVLLCFGGGVVEIWGVQSGVGWFGWCVADGVGVQT